MPFFHRAIVALATLVIVAAAACPAAHAEPTPVDIEHLRALTDIIPRDPPKSGYPRYHESMLPIGMSPKGALAILRHQDNDVVPQWVFQIVDLVRDKDLVRRVWDDSGRDIDLQDLLAAHGDEILVALHEHGITNAPLPYRTVPWDGPAGPFKIQADTVPSEEEFDPTATHELGLIAPDGARKRISRFETRGSWAEITGVLESPYERRVAVLFRTIEPAFEGTSNYRFHILGTHLETGFGAAGVRLQPTPRFQAFIESLAPLGFLPEDAEAMFPEGSALVSVMSKNIPTAFDGLKARHRQSVKSIESTGGGAYYPDANIEEWHYASAAQARAACEAIRAAREDHSTDDALLWKTPQSFTTEGRYLYVVSTRAHAFIPQWRDLSARLEAHLAASADR